MRLVFCLNQRLATSKTLLEVKKAMLRLFNGLLRIYPKKTLKHLMRSSTLPTRLLSASLLRRWLGNMKMQLVVHLNL